MRREGLVEPPGHISGERLADWRAYGGDAPVEQVHSAPNPWSVDLQPGDRSVWEPQRWFGVPDTPEMRANFPNLFTDSKPDERSERDETADEFARRCERDAQGTKVMFPDVWHNSIVEGATNPGWAAAAWKMLAERTRKADLVFPHVTATSLGVYDGKVPKRLAVGSSHWDIV